MHDNDNIEELFRSKAKGLEEKPNDLVRNKIESKLNPKKIHPIREFTQSVWFSAAVYALIAIPYFVIFMIKQNDEESMIQTNQEIVQHSPQQVIESDPKKENVEITKEEIVADQPIEIVKNEPIKSRKSTYVETEIMSAKLESENNILQPVNSPQAYKRSVFSPVETQTDSLVETSTIHYFDQEFTITDSVQSIHFTFVEEKENLLIFKGKEFELILKNLQDSIVVEPNDAIDMKILDLIEQNKNHIYQKYTSEND